MGILRKIILLLFLFPVFGYPQNNTRDSGIALIAYLPGDTIKLHGLLDINRRLAAEGNISEAIELTDKAIAEVEKANPTRNFLVFLQRMVDIYINHGNYPKGTELCFTIKHMAERTGETAIKGDAINSMGIIYWYEGEYKKALTFFEDALKIQTQINGDRSAAGILNNIGLIYRQTGDFDKAIDYYKKSIYYSKKTGREVGEANAYNNLGIVYHLKKEYFNALLYFNLSLDIRKKIQDEIGIATSYGNIGSVYFDTKKYEDAEKYYRDSYSISKRLDDFEGVKEIGKNLYDLYEVKGNSDSTLKYYKIYISARDTLINEATKRDALKREMEYKFEKEQEKKAILDEAENRKQRIFTFSAVSILVLISIFAIVLMKRFRVTNRQKKIIEVKNKEILDSIHYAKRIQQSLLTSSKYIERTLERLKGKS